MTVYRILADLIVLLHAVWVGVVVVGMLLIVVGIWRRWKWVRNFWFRVIHFGMIGIVVGETLGGIPCPLTDWEYDLRIAAGDEGVPGTFMGRVVHGLIFYPLPEWVFNVTYVLFGAAVLLTLILAPPHWPRSRWCGKQSQPPS